MVEQWIKDEINKHNALMYAAHLLVETANGYCENSESERICEALERYGVDPETGDMISPTKDTK